MRCLKTDDSYCYNDRGWTIGGLGQSLGNILGRCLFNDRETPFLNREDIANKGTLFYC